MGIETLGSGIGALAAASVGALGDQTGALATAVPFSTPASAAPAVNTAAVVTFVAPAGQRVRLTHLSFSLGGAAAAASVVCTVTDGSTPLTFDLPTPIGVTAIPLPAGGIGFAAGATVTCTMPAAGAAVLSRTNGARIIA